MFTTRTGNFPIGFRRGGGWQKDVAALIGWARDNEFAAIDLGRSHADVEAVKNAGLSVGSIDLLQWQPMFGADKSARGAAIEQNKTFIAEAAAKGVRNFFLVVLPADVAAPRRKLRLHRAIARRVGFDVGRKRCASGHRRLSGRGRAVLHARNLSRVV